VELIVNSSETFEIIPEIFKNEDKPPKFIFRTPNTADNLVFMTNDDIGKVLYRCFVSFENKIEIKDEKGKVRDYQTYEQFINLGSSPELMQIHIECLNKMAEKITQVREKAAKTQKKSK